MEECQWFLNCHNPAPSLVEHPTLGDVPTCDDHVQWLLDGGLSPTQFVPPLVAAKASKLQRILEGLK